MYHRLAVVCLLFPWLASAEVETLDKLFVQAQDQLLAGDYLTARDNFGKVWKEFERTRGESDSLAIESRIFYGQVLTMTGDHERAMTVLGPITKGDTRNAMIARASFALALRQAGQLDRAIKILKDLVQRFPPASAENLVHLGRMHSELAVCLAYSKRFGEAEDHAQKALHLLDIAEHPVPAHRASVHTILGQIYLLSGRDKEAFETLTKAREEAKPFWRSSHPELGILEGALGVLALRAGRYDEAETRTRSALDALKRLLGPDHPEVGMMSRQLALILKKQKRRDESKEYEARAREILDHPKIEPRVSAWSFREPK